jgi:protein TonB
MIGFSAEDRRDLARWIICGIVVVLVHVGAAAAVVQWRDPVDTDDPDSAMVVDLAPVPVSSIAEQTDMPIGPQQVQSEYQPEQKIEEKQEEKVVAELAPDPDIAVSPPVPEPKPEPPKPPEELSPPVPATTMPEAVQRPELAPVPTAPTIGRPNNSNAVPAWKNQVVGILERNKRYPSEAQERHQQGVAQLAFSIDRQGKVMSSRIVQSSGSSALDAETLELVRRAQPFPAPPPELAGAQITLTVPIRFNIR